MTRKALPALVCALAILAAWQEATTVWFLPLLWLALLVAILALPPDERRLIGPGWATLGMLLLALSWLVALDHELALHLTLVIAAAGLLFGLARRAAPSDDWLGAVAVAVAATGIVGLAQALGGLGRAQALVTTLPESIQAAATARLSGGRVFGTAALPGHFAALLLLAVPILVSRAARSRGAARLAWSLPAAVAVAGIVLTRSLAAVGIGLLLLVATVPTVRRRPWLVVVGGGLLALGAAVIVLARGDIGHLEPLALRWVNWRTAMWAFLAHPWTGVGLGGIGQAGLTAPTAAANITPFAHNTYLELLAEFGVAGAGALVAGFVALTVMIRRGLATDRALALAVLVLPLHNLVDFSAYAPEVVLPWAVLAGALAARTLSLPRRPVPGLVLVPVLSIGVVLATLAWRGEAALEGAVARPGEEGVREALAAARWTPWAVSPLWLAAEKASAPGIPRPALASLLGAVEEREWVRPVSAGAAEVRARLLLALGRPGEALVWAREARRRAPWRGDLAALEDACGGGP